MFKKKTRCHCVVDDDVARQYEGNCKAKHKVDAEGKELQDLSLMTTLKDIGFTPEEIEEYMELCMEDSSQNMKLYMLNQKRKVLLDKVHQQESLINQIDYLRYELQKKG